MSERAVEFSGAGGLKLRGTFLAPVVSPAAPALLLLPGSGPTDRDGNQPPALMTDLLKQFAQYLAGKGIASLRFDKRAAHIHATDWPKEISAINEFFAWDKFVGDASFALKFLREQKEVDKARVGVLGHSEGGLIALQLANDLSGGERPAGLVFMGTPGRPMAAIIRQQVSNALKAQGAPKDVCDEYMAHVERSIKQVSATGTVPSDLPPGLKPLFNAGAAKLLQSYFRLDPPAMAKRFSGPVLVLNGEFDNQVSAQKDAVLLDRALRGRKGSKTALAIVPGASHNFKSVKGLSELGFEGPVVPSALEAVAAWMKLL
jgi:pimeloyl-ACP methyl ester carboxylesterase